MPSDALRISVFDRMVDLLKRAHEDSNPGQPLNEEALTQAVHELVFESSPAELRNAIAEIRKKIAALDELLAAE